MNDISKSYGLYLSYYPWDWFASLTFKNPITLKKAFKRFNTWKVMLKKSTGNHITYFMVAEIKRDNPHLHLLLSGVQNEKPQDWENMWYPIGGLAKIEKYESSKGANYYLGDKMAKGDLHIFMSEKFDSNILALPPNNVGRLQEVNDEITE